MNNIRDLRVRNNLSIIELSKMLGISRQHMYDLQNGKRRLNEDHLEKLCEIFEVSYNDILKPNFASITIKYSAKTTEKELKELTEKLKNQSK
jgi:transcriptional regulator with XRE-family HTH domain